MVKMKHIILVALAAITIAGCNPGIIDAPTTNLSNIKSYFWKTDSSNGPRYARIIPPNTKVVMEYSLVFDQRGSNSFTVGDAFNTTSVPFTVHSDSGNITIANLSPSSLIPLPERYEIVSDQSTEDTIGTAIAIKTVLVTGRKNPLYSAIATDDSGHVYSSSTGGQSWTRIAWDADVKGSITAMAVSQSYEKVYVGTSTGAIYVTNDNGVTWELFHTGSTRSITALCVSQKNVVYASTSDKQVFLIPVATKIADFTIINYSDAVITSLAVIDSDSNGVNIFPRIVAGTAGRGLLYFDLKKPNGWMTSQSLLTNVTQVVPHGRSSFLAIGTTQGGASKVVIDIGSGAWSIIDGMPTNVQYLAGTYTEGFSYAATELGDVYTISTANTIAAKTTMPIKGRRINGISGLEYYVIAATDSGVAVSTTKASSWTTYTKGLEVLTTIQHQAEGELTILQSKGDSLKVGSFWNAGSIKYDSISTSIPITARIFEHYQLYVLPDKAEYNDVFGVSYSYAENIGASLPNLKIYFAKGVGPIMIDQYLGTTLVNRTYYRK